MPIRIRLSILMPIQIRIRIRIRSLPKVLQMLENQIILTFTVLTAVYKFCGLLVSRKENICISLVLVAHF